MLKEGLINCKTLKYLNLSNTDLTCEGLWFFLLKKIIFNSIEQFHLGASAIADVLRLNQSITTVHLSDNDLKQDGIGAVRDSVASNKNLNKIGILPQAAYPSTESQLSFGVVSQMLDDIESCCAQHRLEATFDEFDSILSGVSKFFY